VITADLFIVEITENAAHENTVFSHTNFMDLKVLPTQIHPNKTYISSLSQM